VPSLENCATFGKMRHTWNNVPHLKTWVTILNIFATLGKMEKCATLGRICHTWKNVKHAEKCATLGIMGHNFKKCATLGKMRHS